MKYFGTISKNFHRPYNGLYGFSGTLPLAGIDDLTATESGGTVSLTWTDPDDVVKGGKTITSRVSTKIVRKEGSAPTDSTDGDLILTETTKNQYSSSGYVDSSISVSGTYYYVAFAVADNGLETISNIEEVAVVVSSYKTYTIVRDEVSDPTQFFVKYDDDATGKTQGSTDFDTFFGYSAVLLDESGNEVEEVVQSSPGVLNMNSFQGALTGTANNVMIKFPRRGIKMSKNGTQITLSITNDPNKEGFQYYAFTKGETAKNNLYLGAYKGSFSNNDSSVASSFDVSTTKLKSWSNAYSYSFSPAVHQSHSNFHSSAVNNGLGYSLTTIYAKRYISCLYMMKYGNPNSQSVVGYGIGNMNVSAPGGTNSQTNATYGTSSNADQIKLFGLEDRWGNVQEFIDCCYYGKSLKLSVDPTNSIFQYSAYNLVFGNIATGFTSGIVGTNDGMFYPNAGSGSDSTYYTDHVDELYPNRVLLAGGDYSKSTQMGIFYLFYTTVDNEAGNFGARLMYL